ncbi:Protein of unknown function [Pyronema omphalodes CBS 100304]|uniref:Uncharacterized protein n=1 Tax=Pyronema omphalodes (strain CBS 100304) TaxID=1076935 RepID=U4LGC6_PYROM|nr:Protein of unknown function [Pyronema omphalodes CBS 100304]
MALIIVTDLHFWTMVIWFVHRRRLAHLPVSPHRLDVSYSAAYLYLHGHPIQITVFYGHLGIAATSRTWCRYLHSVGARTKGFSFT